MAKCLALLAYVALASRICFAAESIDKLETSAAVSTPKTAAKTVANGDGKPVTQKQYLELLDLYKRTQERFDKLEAKLNAGVQSPIDLSTNGTDKMPMQSSTSNSPHGRGSSGATPSFRVYFDLDLISRPGIENLSFDNYHSFLFFELLPTPDIQFSFDVSPSPRYFELDYQMTQKLQLRAGKIWIPFDDMSPHNIFGGRVNVSRLTAESGAPAFLPDLWTDLGVGFRLNVVDTLKFSLDMYGYVVNGFRQGGNDPVTPGSPYPIFSDLPTAFDNNRDKALGGRLHMLFFQKVGLGISYYNGRWNNDTGGTGASIDSKRVSILGADAQIRIRQTEFRMGAATMAANLPTGDVANRGGAYVELGQSFGTEHTWKLLGRAGFTQLDDRVTDTNPAVSLGDEEIVGATLLWKPGLVQYSLEYSRDLEVSPAKLGYTYVAARLVMAF